LLGLEHHTRLPKKFDVCILVFQKICPGIVVDVEASLDFHTVVNDIFHSCFMLIGFVTVGILMISIKTVCRQIQNSIMNERNEFKTPANLDSIVLNLVILLIFITNSILFTTYWKG
jgi:hypothetical protein